MIIRVTLPYHLRTLARVDGDVQLEVEEPSTLGSALDALEARYPVLRGFYACKEDLSHEPPDTPLPGEVISGVEPLLVIGAMAGG